MDLFSLFSEPFLSRPGVGRVAGLHIGEDYLSQSGDQCVANRT